MEVMNNDSSMNFLWLVAPTPSQGSDKKYKLLVDVLM